MATSIQDLTPNGDKAMGWKTTGSRFESCLRQEISFLSTVARLALGTSILSSGYPKALSSGVKQPENYVNYSPQSTVEIKKAWSHTSSQLHKCVIKYTWDNFTTFTLNVEGAKKKN
jgi:hypothetical protein